MAHALLKVFYPSLLRQQLYFGTKGDEGVPFDSLASPLMHFAVVVVKPPDDVSPLGRRREILSGHIDFDFDGQLTGWLANDSDFINADSRRRLEARIGPNLSDSKVAAILSDEGVKYGLGAEQQMIDFVRPLLVRLEPFIGKTTTVGAALKLGDYVAWIVSVRAEKEGSTFDYTLAFEPFEGKLTAVHRYPK